MSIGLNISNKLKQELEKENEKKKLTNSAVSILEGEEDENKDNAEKAAGESVQEPNFPKEFNLNLDSTDPAGELAKIDNFYREQREAQKAKEGLNLERLASPTETEEDIISSVKNSVDSRFNRLKNEKTEEYDNLINAKIAEKDSARANQKASEDKINAYYDVADESVSNNVLKRGLARSSIAVLELDGLTKERANELSQTANKLSNDLDEIDKSILSLEAQRENALINLDLDWATQLENEIKSGLDALEKKRKEVVEFNNNVTKLEKEYNLKQEKQNTDLAIDKLNAGLSIEDFNANSNSSRGPEVQYKVSYINSYLNKLPKAQALKILTTDNQIAYYLGDAFSSVYYFQVQRQA